VPYQLKDQLNTVAHAPKELCDMQERAKKRGANKLTGQEIDAIISEARKEPIRWRRRHTNRITGFLNAPKLWQQIT
jgi:hypothetical protein